MAKAKLGKAFHVGPIARKIGVEVEVFGISLDEAGQILCRNGKPGGTVDILEESVDQVLAGEIQFLWPIVRTLRKPACPIGNIFDH